MVPTRHDLPEDDRKKVVGILNQQLANTFDLYSQSKQAHWNVKGPRFYMLHKLFDEVAELVEAGIDQLAERAAQLGGVAHGTVRQAAQHSQLPEFPQDALAGNTAITALADRLAVHAAALRKAIDDATRCNDADTADLLTSLSEDVDKALWLVEAHLQADN